MKVLFVDDEVQILRALERMLDTTEPDWDCEFVNSGAEALSLLKDGGFDAIVTDMRMPGMDGAQLLAEVTKVQPDIVRIVLSGEADRRTVLRAAEPMHQYLAKPCDPASLKSTIVRAGAMRKTLDNEVLRQTVGGLEKLPSLPSTYQKLVEAMNDENITLERIGNIIENDIAMTTKVLQLVNSAAFGITSEVSGPAKAASLLGMDTIKSLVLCTGVFQQFEDQGAAASIDELMSHSQQVATYATQIARAEMISNDLLNDVYTSGLIHDLGKLVLMTSAPDKYREVNERMSELAETCVQAEEAVFGADHAAVGAYLLRLWGLPQSIIEIVALHHRPEAAEECVFSPLIAVWVANELANGTEDGELTSRLAEISCEDRLAHWKKICMGAEEATS